MCLIAGMKKELTWEEHINRCLQLGTSKKSYCEENNLSYQLFFYHQRKLMERKSALGFQEIILEKSSDTARNLTHESTSVLQIQFVNGHRLLFSEHFLERVFQLCQSI